MGACYDVTATLKIKNGEQRNLLRALQKELYRTENLHKFCSCNYDNVYMDKIKNILVFIYGQKNNDSIKIIDAETIEIDSSFDSRYSWEGVMIDFMQVMAPYLKDKSKMYIYPDSDYDYLVIENGECIQKH